MPRLLLWLVWSAMLLYPLTLSAQVQISGLSDLHFGSWSGFGDLEGTVDHCVFASRGGAYAVEAAGTGPGGAFALENGPGILPFQLAYDDGSGWSQMDPGVPLTGQRGSPNANQFERCLDGSRPPKRLRVRILAQELGLAVAGNYGGSLMLLIAPE